jgi:hypothetical protein
VIKARRKEAKQSVAACSPLLRYSFQSLPFHMKGLNNIPSPSECIMKEEVSSWCYENIG